MGFKETFGAVFLSAAGAMGAAQAQTGQDLSYQANGVSDEQARQICNKRAILTDPVTGRTDAFMSVEYATSIDGQKPEAIFGRDYQSNVPNSSTPYLEATNQYGTLFFTYLFHRATQHDGDCAAIVGNKQREAGRDPNRILGAGWEQKTSCTLGDWHRRCEGLDGPGN